MNKPFLIVNVCKCVSEYQNQFQPLANWIALLFWWIRSGWARSAHWKQLGFEEFSIRFSKHCWSQRRPLRKCGRLWIFHDFLQLRGFLLKNWLILVPNVGYRKCTSLPDFCWNHLSNKSKSCTGDPLRLSWGLYQTFYEVCWLLFLRSWNHCRRSSSTDRRRLSSLLY